MKRVLLIVLCVVIALASVLLAFVSPVFLVGVALAVFLVVWDSKRRKKEAVKAPPISVQKASNSEEIKVAGISNYLPAVRSLGTKNDVFAASAQDIIDLGLADQEIYEYDFPICPAEFVFEPDNEYDKNAIAVYVSGAKIGYVKREDIKRVRALLDAGQIKRAECEFVGGKFKRLNSDDNSIERFNWNIGARITIYKNEM